MVCMEVLTEWKKQVLFIINDKRYKIPILNNFKFSHFIIVISVGVFNGAPCDWLQNFLLELMNYSNFYRGKGDLWSVPKMVSTSASQKSA